MSSTRCCAPGLDPKTMILRDWHDFVTYPLDPDAVQTDARRLKTDDATLATQGMTDIAAHQPFLVRQGDIIFEPGDAFEAMEITPFGVVTIWTTRNVWTLMQDRGIEKLRFVRRHPPTVTP